MKTFLLYRFARYILCAGTAFEAFRQVSRLLPHNILGIAVALFFSGVIVLLFDGTAFSYLEQLARHFTGQQKMRTRSGVAITGLLGLLAFAAGATFSLFSVPAVSEAMVEDKSGAYLEMQATRQAADKSFERLLAAAEAEIIRAEEQAKQTSAKAETARAAAIKQVGGEFARLHAQNNDWIWTAPSMRAQRKQVAEIEKSLLAAHADAKNNLQAAQEVKRNLLTQGRAEHNAGVQAVLGAGQVTVQTWQNKLMQSNRIVLYVVIAAMLFSIIFLIKMATDGYIPEFKDLPEVLADSYELALNAILAGLSGMNRAAEKVGTMGIASVPTAAAVPRNPVPPHTGGGIQAVPPTCPPTRGTTAPPDAPLKTGTTVPPHTGDRIQTVVPPSTAPAGRTTVPPHVRKQVEKLRDNIKKYNRRAKEGTLREESRVRLDAWKKELADLLSQYYGRS